jgi:hypothetical protein
MGALGFRAAKRDDSEPEVVAAFVEGGATVWKISGANVPDLMVGFLGRTHAVEVKTGNAVLTAGQLAAFGPSGAWAGEPVQIARNGAQAKRLLRQWEVAAAALESKGDAR